MTSNDLLRRIRRLANPFGWSLEIAEGGDHPKIRLQGRGSVMPRHAKDLPTGTQRAILKQRGITIMCPDVPEMVTGGWCELQANLDPAPDALAAALSCYVDDNRRLPTPSPARGRPVVAAKLALYRAKRKAGMTNVELGHRLGMDEKDIRRLLDPLHNSRIGQVELALKALGRRLVVEERAVA